MIRIDDIDEQRNSISNRILPRVQENALKNNIIYDIEGPHRDENVIRIWLNEHIVLE